MVSSFEIYEVTFYIHFCISMRATYTTHLILLDLITTAKLNTEYATNCTITRTSVILL
jgi:hypothetical protein